MKTQDQIVARIKEKEHAKSSFLGFDLEVLIFALDFERAKPWLQPAAKETEWEPATERTDEAIKRKALDYLDFAWGKVEDHRGISAGRSVVKMTEFCWLLGLDELVGRIDREEIGYPQYGAPILKAISEALGFPVPTTPEMARMMIGASCVPGCENGCGQ